MQRSWYRKALLAADRTTLGVAFGRADYTAPPSSFLIAARVVRGVRQPAFQYFSLGDSGFTYSPGHFWPASTVKLLATVGALWTLGKYGLTGNATLDFADADGSYSGPVHAIYDKALRLSTNIEYNRLMLIAGYDEINGYYTTEATGLPTTVLQRRYGRKIPGVNLRRSPELRYREGKREGIIPAREAKLDYPECPAEGNCTSMFELLEVIRRVTLQPELPRPVRFPIGRTDWNRIMKALSLSHKKLEPGASQALGHPVKIYNKAGRYPGDDHLDAALVVDTVTGQRYLIAPSVHYGSPNEPDDVTARQLVEMARNTLSVMRHSAKQPPPLQLDAGEPIAVALEHRGPTQLDVTIALRAPRATELRVWLDGVLLPHAAAMHGQRRIEHTFAASGDHLLVVQALRRGRLIGYRAAVIESR